MTDVNPSKPYPPTQFTGFGEFNACPLSDSQAAIPFVEATALNASYNATLCAENHGVRPVPKSCILTINFVGDPFTGEIYTSFGGSEFDDDVGTEHCFRLKCSIDVVNSEAYRYPMPTIGNSAVAPYIEVIGSMLITTSGQTSTVTGQCALSIYGSLLPFFSSSRSSQPSGVYECELSNSAPSSLSQAASLAMSSFSIISVVCIVGVIVWRVGFNDRTVGGKFW